MSIRNTTMDTDALAITCYGKGGIKGCNVFLAVPVEDCRLIEIERDQCLYKLENLTNIGLDLMDKNRVLNRKLKKIKKVIIATLEENRHLADGDDCTLAKLKSVVPDWK